MSESVLFVDDEPNVLDGIRRQLRKKVDVDTATSGEQGLQKIRDGGPFAVVISDMRMPGMNGSGFLAEVRKISPDSIRMILSGQAELESTIEAVNEGHIFRFLTKPCSSDSLFTAVESGIEQYRLIQAERQLLEQTLGGVVKMLMEILGIANPTAHDRATRMQRYAMDIASELGLADEWQFRLAAMLSQIGCITLPPDTLARLHAGQKLSPDEQEIYSSHPKVAGKLLASVPRLEGVAEIISHHLDTIDLATLPDDIAQWDKTTLQATILHAATDLHDLVVSGMPAQTAVSKLEKKTRRYPQKIRDSLCAVRIAMDHVETRMVRTVELEIGMVLDEDIMSKNGLRLIPSNQEVTQTILLRLQSIAKGMGIVEPFRVNVLR